MDSTSTPIKTLLATTATSSSATSSSATTTPSSASSATSVSSPTPRCRSASISDLGFIFVLPFHFVSLVMFFIWLDLVFSVSGVNKMMVCSVLNLHGNVLRRVLEFEETQNLVVTTRELRYFVTSDYYLWRVPDLLSKGDLRLPTGGDDSMSPVILPLTLISWVVVCDLMNVFVKSPKKNLHRVVDLVSPIQTHPHVCGMLLLRLLLRFDCPVTVIGFWLRDSGSVWIMFVIESCIFLFVLFV